MRTRRGAHTGTLKKRPSQVQRVLLPHLPKGQAASQSPCTHLPLDPAPRPSHLPKRGSKNATNCRLLLSISRVPVHRLSREEVVHDRGGWKAVPSRGHARLLLPPRRRRLHWVRKGLLEELLTTFVASKVVGSANLRHLWLELRDRRGYPVVSLPSPTRSLSRRFILKTM